jgi:hypothetical protein
MLDTHQNRHFVLCEVPDGYVNAGGCDAGQRRYFSVQRMGINYVARNEPSAVLGPLHHDLNFEGAEVDKLGENSKRLGRSPPLSEKSQTPPASSDRRSGVRL